jgi:hypothetical protein
MQNNRDSSVLRSLAIAFGDGLAFGAGMKLTQGGAQNAGAGSRIPAPALDTKPLLQRLEAIESRIGKAGQVPATSSSPPATTPAPFDQKMLEAIVMAIDGRLHEQAGQVERRLTEIESNIAAELKVLQQQDHSVMAGVQSQIEDWSMLLRDQLSEVRRRSDEERAATQREIASLRDNLNDRAAVEHAYQGQPDQSGQTAAMQEQISALRTGLEAKLAAEIAPLLEQDLGVLSRVQAHIDELNVQFDEQLAAIRRHSDEERAAVQIEIAQLHSSLETKLGLELAPLRRLDLGALSRVKSNIADLNGQFDGQLAAIRQQAEEARTALQAEIASLRNALESKLAADLASGPQRDQNIQSRVEAYIADLNGQFDGQLANARRQSDEERAALKAEIVALRSTLESKLAADLASVQERNQGALSQVESHMADLNGRFDGQLAKVSRQSEEERAALQAEIVSLRSTLDSKVAAELTSGQQRDQNMLNRMESYLADLHGQFDIQVANVRRLADEERAALQAEITTLRSTLQTKLATDLNAVQQRDQSVLTQVESHIHDLNAQFNERLAAIHRQADEERALFQKDFAALHHEFALEAAQAVENSIASMRAEIAARDGQIAELRNRLESSDESLRNVVGAISHACQIAVGRPAPKAAAPAESPAPAANPVPSADPSLPASAQTDPKNPNRVMSFALVSSLALVSVTCAAVAHYL